MLAEIISFGGYVKERRTKPMRIEAETANKVQVITKSAVRDAKTGRIKYETVDSFNIVDATPDEVARHVRKAFSNAAK